jgi:AhpC/TSA family
MSRNLDLGTAIPDFRLPDENGVEHTLSELQGDNALVLHLSRGEHCPRERQFHLELRRFYEWASVAFTELVSVLPDSLHAVYRLKLSTGARWTFLGAPCTSGRHRPRRHRLVKPAPHGYPPSSRTCSMWKRNSSSLGADYRNAPSRSATKPSTDTLIE